MVVEDRIEKEKARRQAEAEAAELRAAIQVKESVHCILSTLSVRIENGRQAEAEVRLYNSGWQSRKRNQYSESKGISILSPNKLLFSVQMNQYPQSK